MRAPGGREAGLRARPGRRGRGTRTTLEADGRDLSALRRLSEERDGNERSRSWCSTRWRDAGTATRWRTFWKRRAHGPQQIRDRNHHNRGVGRRVSARFRRAGRSARRDRGGLHRSRSRQHGFQCWFEADPKRPTLPPLAEPDEEAPRRQPRRRLLRRRRRSRGHLPHSRQRPRRLLHLVHRRDRGPGGPSLEGRDFDPERHGVRRRRGRQLRDHREPRAPAAQLAAARARGRQHHHPSLLGVGAQRRGGPDLPRPPLDRAGRDPGPAAPMDDAAIAAGIRG